MELPGCGQTDYGCELDGEIYPFGATWSKVATPAFAKQDLILMQTEFGYALKWHVPVAQILTP